MPKTTVDKKVPSSDSKLPKMADKSITKNKKKPTQEVKKIQWKAKDPSKKKGDN
jgi:hypothetical protein